MVGITCVWGLVKLLNVYIELLVHFQNFWVGVGGGEDSSLWEFQGMPCMKQ